MRRRRFDLTPEGGGADGISKLQKILSYVIRLAKRG